MDIRDLKKLQERNFSLEIRNDGLKPKDDLKTKDELRARNDSRTNDNMRVRNHEFGIRNDLKAKDDDLDLIMQHIELSLVTSGATNVTEYTSSLKAVISNYKNGKTQDISIPQLQTNENGIIDLRKKYSDLALKYITLKEDMHVPDVPPIPNEDKKKLAVLAKVMQVLTGKR